MYIPYLRGRQYELIALKELLAGNLISERIIPVIEPIKPIPALATTLRTYREKNRNIAVVCNPGVGEFANLIKVLKKDKPEKEKDIIEEIKQDNVIKSYIIKSGVLSQIKNNQEKEKFLTINTNRDSLDSFVKIYEDTFPRFTLIPNELAFKRISGNSKVLLQDHYNKQPRNVDYMDIDDEFFSDDHLNYLEEGFVGFSDYSIVGNDFKDSGFAPLAIAIHIVYFDSHRRLRIKHFVSISNDDIHDPANKFGEALAKLVKWCDENNITKTEGLRQLYVCHQTGKYPGLGTAKKYSIMHHLELMSRFLDGEI